jgi:hypothetical protein
VNQTKRNTQIMQTAAQGFGLLELAGKDGDGIQSHAGALATFVAPIHD